jgi:hypothetical protein
MYVFKYVLERECISRCTLLKTFLLSSRLVSEVGRKIIPTAYSPAAGSSHPMSSCATCDAGSIIKQGNSSNSSIQDKQKLRPSQMFLLLLLLLGAKPITVFSQVAFSYCGFAAMDQSVKKMSLPQKKKKN